MECLGVHLLDDLVGCDAELLDNSFYISQIMVEAARMANATIIHKHFHKFKPQGVTGFLLLSESHISIHTWPELGKAAVDFYSCGDIDARAARDYLVDRLKATNSNTQEIIRGSLNA